MTLFNCFCAPIYALIPFVRPGVTISKLGVKKQLNIVGATKEIKEESRSTFVSSKRKKNNRVSHGETTKKRYDRIKQPYVNGFVTCYDTKDPAPTYVEYLI